MGSPSYFGNMAAPLKAFLDTTTGLWFKGSLVNKPACVFTSSSSMHGGQESTLLNMMIPLFHHGMIIKGLPYTIEQLAETTTGGTPYGASHYNAKGRNIDSNEQQFCLSQGKMLAELVKKLT